MCVYIYKSHNANIYPLPFFKTSVNGGPAHFVSSSRTSTGLGLALSLHLNLGQFLDLNPAPWVTLKLTTLPALAPGKPRAPPRLPPVLLGPLHLIQLS